MKYAIFSNTGRLVGYSNFAPPGGRVKELPEDFDPLYHIYDGDYDTGSVTTIDEHHEKKFKEFNPDKKWVIFESQVNERLRNIITDGLGHKPYKQLNLIAQALYDNKDKLTLSEEFIKMCEEINDVRTRHKLSIDSYINLHEQEKLTYVKKEDEAEFHDKFTKQKLDLNK
jgi:hypothetical protein